MTAIRVALGLVHFLLWLVMFCIVGWCLIGCLAWDHATRNTANPSDSAQSLANWFEDRWPL